MHKYLQPVIAVVAVLSLIAPAMVQADDAAAEPSYVVFETTDGDITFEVHPEWSPLGAARFIELTEAGFYDGAPWFRVIDGFVAQCGISADPAVNLAWNERTFPDEPVIQGNLPGYVAFGKSGAPDSRTTHIYINYVDNSRLDHQGFCCFARVVRGMDVALGLHKCQFTEQGELAAAGGMEKFREQFPEADFILKAYTIERPGLTGVIEVNSNPTGAEVYIDGFLEEGVTPLALAGIFPGRHHVACKLPDGRELTGSVDVQPDKIAKIRFMFAGTMADKLEDSMDEQQVVYVVLNTTKGDIVLEVHKDWSPLGAQHFIELVEDGFYNGAPWFRVIEGFVAQCGVSANPELNLKWGENTFADEPVVQGNEPGYLAFGKSGMPDSRSTHIFINYRDNSGGLDAQGFCCFAKVHTGMDLALDLHKCEWGDQHGLGQPDGLDRFKQAFPEADFILEAYVVADPDERK